MNCGWIRVSKNDLAAKPVHDRVIDEGLRKGGLTEDDGRKNITRDPDSGNSHADNISRAAGLKGQKHVSLETYST